MSDSIFSKIIDRKISADIIAETDDLIVIRDINPKAKIHLLIIPKKEIANIPVFSDDDCRYGAKIFKMAKHLSKTIPGADQFQLIMNNGERAGQEVFHAHVHFLAN